MEAQIQNIELINNYLNKKLSGEAVKDFENRLKTDDTFRLLYEEHVVLLEGMKRQILKTEIKTGKQKYIRGKWLRYFGFTSMIIALIVSVIGYINIGNSNSNNQDFKSKEIIISNTVLDSVVSNDSIKDAIKIIPPEIKQVIVEKVEKNNTENKKEIAEVKIPKKHTQAFIINQKKDTTIVCNEGTKLTIKANSFVDSNNKVVTRKINLKVTEYYKLSDVLLANLSTQSGDKLLETGGMLFIEAKQNNKKLLLNENKPIEILFPTKKKDMQLFTGDWESDNINWELQKETVFVEETEILEIEEDIDVPFAVVEEVPIFPGCENLSRDAARRCMSDKIDEFVKRNFNGDKIAEDIGLVGRQRINVIFKIDKNGDVVDIRSRVSDPELEIEAERVIALLPKMKPGKQRGKPVNVPYSLPIIFQVDGTASVGRSSLNRRNRDSVFVNKVERKFNSEEKKKVHIAEVNSYILWTSKLGWINCDKFIRAKNSIRYTVKMNEAEGEIRLNMVFKRWNSVLSGRRSGKSFDFRMAPKNEDIILIAIKKDKGKFYLDILEATTEENPNIEFNFKEVDLEGLKAELKRLNKLF